MRYEVAKKLYKGDKTIIKKTNEVVRILHVFDNFARDPLVVPYILVDTESYTGNRKYLTNKEIR